jgi:hypothetical protein
MHSWMSEFLRELRIAEWVGFLRAQATTMLRKVNKQEIAMCHKLKTDFLIKYEDTYTR